MNRHETSGKPELPDRYVVEAFLGRGNMGAVYRARDTLLDKLVAVKVMIHGADAGAQARFQREARMASRLNHPNIIQVLDFGITDGDCPFMVMEHVDGRTLAELIEERGRLSLAESIPVFAQIAQALAHAHGQGVLHRDLKAQNVLLTGIGEGALLVKLVDFGLAKPVGDEGLATLTRDGAIVGSPLYMSPEQAKTADVDARSDLYSFGCLMFEALTGDVPIRGDTVLETFSLKAARKAPSLADAGFDYGEELERIVATCLSIDPRDRFASANMIAEALSAYEGGGTTTQGDGLASAEEAGPEREKRHVPAMIAVSVFVFLMVPVGFFFWPAQDETERESGTDSKPGKQETETGQFSLLDVDGQRIVEEKGGVFRCQLGVTDADLESFARSEDASRLRTLVVQGDGIMGPGLASLKDLPIVKLEFVCPLKNPDEAMKYVSAIKSLTTLRLHGCFTLSGRGLERLAKLPNLTYLCLENSGLIDDDSIAIINTFPKIKDLLIPRTNVRARGLAMLDRKRHFDQLSLAANMLTDADLDSLACLEIRSPDLSINPRLTPGGVSRFMKGRKLLEITLKDIPWKERDFIELSRAYPQVLIHTRETVSVGGSLETVKRDYRNGRVQK